ncbi:hypothetical protein E4U19_005373 [Claviceps sp. Clav32 group G5]|nr:hypothetical protein E4U19_005373 [Claviceps sp. Clav32 group G5]KAG6034495.1 hypothetical protein E4U40_003779 [Claviceps sp. LM458 group G5]KAG6046976.1 hypothetical protein E4U39_000816 [Claviceps sp. Clav50 group G5]
MKFSAILGSLAIYGLQVHAIPTDLDPQAIQPIEASSPIPNTLEARDTYCCVGLKSSERDITKFIPRGPGTYQWYALNDYNDCLVYVKRNPNSCAGWTFKAVTCDDLGSHLNIAIRPAGNCRN